MLCDTCRTMNWDPQGVPCATCGLPVSKFPTFDLRTGMMYPFRPGNGGTSPPDWPELRYIKGRIIQTAQIGLFS